MKTHGYSNGSKHSGISRPIRRLRHITVGRTCSAGKLTNSQRKAEHYKTLVWHHVRNRAQA